MYLKKIISLSLSLSLSNYLSICPCRFLLFPNLKILCNFAQSNLFTTRKMYVTALLISVYLFIVISTGSLLFLITKYLQDKPFGQQFVTDKLSADLAMFVFMTIFFLSFTVIIRELTGPFSEDTTQIVLAIQQFFNLSVLLYLLAMQVAQFSNVFFSLR